MKNSNSPWHKDMGQILQPPRRTLSDDLRDQEAERLSRIEEVRWGDKDPAVARDFDCSYRPMGEGNGRRQPVRYE